MTGKRSSLILSVACAAVALLLAAVPVNAARYGGGRGGGYGGGYRGGYGGGYRGGWGGGLGFGLGYGLGAYYGGYYPGYYGGYNSGYYDNYYNPPVILDSTPYTSGYYTPPAAVVTPDTSAPADSRAHVEVLVPAPDAQVFFDGAATRQQGTDRVFYSPPLNAGQTFTYNVEARWTENGRMMDTTKSVSVTAGQSAVVDFGR